MHAPKSVAPGVTSHAPDHVTGHVPDNVTEHVIVHVMGHVMGHVTEHVPTTVPTFLHASSASSGLAECGSSNNAHQEICQAGNDKTWKDPPEVRRTVHTPDSDAPRLIRK